MLQPRLSVIVCTHNMARAAPRTILSSGPPYQQGIAAEDYEVIVLENGSTDRLAVEAANLPPNVRIVDVADQQPSPVFAMNWAARELARGQFLLLAIDGARIFSDRLFERCLAAHDEHGPAFVYTLAWHLGPEVQMQSVPEGYDAVEEDRLIEKCGWPARPGGLYEISVFAGSSRPGFFRPIAESNAFSVSRDVLVRMGGYDERFTSPGGGLCNLEIFERYALDEQTRNVCVVGEGTFHQVHGGVATNHPGRFREFAAEYERILGRAYSAPQYEFTYVWSQRPEVRPFIDGSAARAGIPRPLPGEPCPGR